LRNESDKKLQDVQHISAPSTPTKRKREGDVKTPTKRSKQTVKQESVDGEPFSDVSSSPVSQDLKVEEEQKVPVDAYPPSDTFYIPQDFYKNGYGQITPESSMVSSSTSSSYVSGNYLG
jgi:hypothetical protein